MPQPTNERRSAPRRTDSAIRFRWLGARRDEPVENLSQSGAHLLTFRSAPVGSCVEFELLHADGVSIRLMGVVRRVERPGRGAASDGLLGLSVEFRDLDAYSERTMERWYQEATVGGADDPANWGSEQGQDQAAKPPTHEGRLWDSGAPPEEPEDPTQLAEAAVSRAKETESILELQHRVARAEQLATEALDKLNRAEERVLELEDQKVPEPSSSMVAANEPDGAERSRDEPLPSGVGAMMVDALSDSSEVHPPDSLGPNRFGFGQLGKNDAPLDETRDEEAQRPISGAVRSFSALAAERMAEKSLTESTEAGGEASEEGDLETRAFSLELLAAGRAASVVDTEVEQDSDEQGSDEQRPEAELAEEKPDGEPNSEPENEPVATERVWPDLEIEAFEPEAPKSDRETVPPQLANAGEVFEEITEASDESDDTDPESAVVMVVEELPPVGSSSSWADVGSEGEGASAEASETVAPTMPRRRVSYREIPTFEGMLEAMAKGNIVRTERFSRLEPVSRVDIQVSDLLLECDQLSTLEKKTVGVVDRDQLHKVLFVFFQRELIEVELLEG